MDEKLENQADTVVQKIKHYLISSMGRTFDEANDEEIYRAFCYALREEIMINWTATSHTLRKPGVRKLYFLSMEYMPGRLLYNNIANIGSVELVKCVLQKLGKNFGKMLAIEPDIGIGNGGLGRLASCFMDSLATLAYPALGYGMRYQYGIFEQELWLGVQVERPDTWLLNENPWEFRRDPHAVVVKLGGRPLNAINIHGDEIYHLAEYEEVRAIAYDFPMIGYSKHPDFSVLTLRLWSTKNSPRNFQLQRFNAGQLDQASENISLTDVLYPNDNNEAGKRIRLKQEFLLVSASLQDIIFQHLRTYPNMEDFGDKVRIQINDTHPSLIIAELIRILVTTHDFPWQKAVETTRTVCGYTNHTVLREALEEWNEQRVEKLLPRQYKIIQQLNQNLCDEVRKIFPMDEDKVRRMSIIEGGQIKMSHLAIYGSHKVNGVAALHSALLKEQVFKDFADLFPDKFTNVTNGVTQRRWLLNANPELSEFITDRIGSEWITRFSDISRLKEFASDPKSQQIFLEIKRRCKKRLLTMLIEELDCHDDKCPILDTDALFDLQIKRFHEYKRQLMNALHILTLYNELKTNPNHSKGKRLVIFSGKAAPGYQMAKHIIRLIYCIARKINQDLTINGFLKVVFVENYNVSKAEILIPAADLSEQISTAGLEASGTGNMKLAMNGALTIGTEDGANVEMRQAIGDEWWPFRFGSTSAENFHMHKDRSYRSQDILDHYPEIAAVVESLRNGSLSENEAEHEAFCSIYQSLQEDPFFILKDLPSYCETQKKVALLFETPLKWAEYAIHNIAGMGSFSTDHSIKTYAENIWDLTPYPPSKEELKRVRDEFSAHDRCKIVL
ncbi:MAG: glycogen/starch/alpha-glucan family phosphorylase [Simkaniaceae bacterium]|nr:glycogen/starch/alpha-glucan family phosphorylase [Simkaniaceae bacterium]